MNDTLLLQGPATRHLAPLLLASNPLGKCPQDKMQIASILSVMQGQGLRV